MKNITYYLIIVIILFYSCGDFDEINRNPDATTTVPPAFLVTSVLLNETYRPSSKWLLDDSWLMKSTSFTEHMEWYLYNKFERGSFDEITNLINTKKMVELAEKDPTLPEEEINAYKAFDHFSRAYFFYNLTMAMGDIPCSESLKGESTGDFSPKYDSQEKVFLIILDELNESKDLFGKASVLKGDFIYNGDVGKWQRLVNSFALRVLNMLSKKQNVGGINIRTAFENFAFSPIFENENDSFMRVYNASKSSQRYPFYYLNQNYWSYPVMTSFFIDMLKELNDYRLFYYAEPATALSHFPENSFDAYSGVNPVLEFGQIQAQFTEGLHSSINKRYYLLPEGEPIKFICYSEIQFILAEASLRGWRTPLSAKEHYENGVKAAMKFTADHTPSEFRHSVVIDDEYIDSYLKGEAAFKEEIGIQQIMIQKYIASFIQLHFNSYYDYRRTGFPVIPIDPTTNMNEVKDQLPLRWMYPESEYSYNRENIEEAILRQFNGSDTPNDVMWLLQ